MAFDPTQGTSTTNSYATIAEVDAFFADRGGFSVWDLCDKESTTIKATDYLERKYAARYNTGVKATSAQRLSWPRNDAYYSSLMGGQRIPGTPREVLEAIYETILYLLDDSANDLMPVQGRATKSEKVGSLQVVYMDSATTSVSYPKVDFLLQPLISGVGSKLIRSN